MIEQPFRHHGLLGQLATQDPGVRDGDRLLGVRNAEADVPVAFVLEDFGVDLAILGEDERRSVVVMDDGTRGEDVAEEIVQVGTVGAREIRSHPTALTVHLVTAAAGPLEDLTSVARIAFREGLTGEQGTVPGHGRLTLGRESLDRSPNIEEAIADRSVEHPREVVGYVATRDRAAADGLGKFPSRTRTRREGVCDIELVPRGERRVPKEELPRQGRSVVSTSLGLCSFREILA